mgnify:CR=1 FL=1
MARKKALTMSDGAEVNDLDELRREFDLGSVMKYFRSGELVEWLNARNYINEAKLLAAIDADSPHAAIKLSMILRVDNDKIFGTKLIFRTGETRDFLMTKTDDWDIIKNARITALNQYDLLYLLDLGEPKIYLCGENFTVPSEIGKRHYIGVLGTPRIEIQARDQAELDAKYIMFENVMLPWGAALPLVPSDGDNAFRICRDAAEAGDVGAMAKLADMYWFGYGIPLNKQKALVWYSRAAAHGDEYAMKTMAIFHRDGVN